MESSAKKMRRRRHRRRRARDRLSDLPDDILGQILSLLPTEEVGRAAVLSRRWRRAFQVVQTISFQPVETRAMNPAAENMRLVDRVGEALVTRRNLCGVDAPLRCLRVAMRCYTAPNCYAVDKWLAYALGHDVHELRLETSTHAHAYTGGGAIEQCCGNDDDDSSDSSDDYDTSDDDDSSDSSDDYVTSDDDDSSDSSDDYDGSTGVPLHARLPQQNYDVSPELFSCATLQALHLASCSLPPLQLPSTIHLPSLETLSLTNITHNTSLPTGHVLRQISGENIQRVVSCCPRLADLTLEACDQIMDITVKRLTSFALRCCHSVRRVTIDAPETLRAFEYRGGPPDASCFTLVGGGAMRISSVKINLCGRKRSRKIDSERVRELLLLFVNATHLQLNVIMNSRLDHDEFHCLHFPRFHNLTKLEMGSCCTDPRVLHRVAGVLRQTPNLTALVIKLGRSRHESSYTEEKYRFQGVPNAPTQCLREPAGVERNHIYYNYITTMSVEQYEGADVQKMLLKWLLRGALVVESVRVVWKDGRCSMPADLVSEIKSWVRNPATRMTFS